MRGLDQEATVVSQDASELEEEFGLEGNSLEADDAGAGEGEGDGDAGDGGDPPETPAEPATGAVETETARLEQFAGMDDNLDVLQAQKDSKDKAAAAAAAKDTAAAGDDVATPPDEGTADDDGVPLTEVQTYLDELTTTHGDKLLFSWKANGQDRRGTLAELKTAAAGYMGQEGVHKTLADATKAREDAQKLRTEAESITALNKVLIEAIDDPETFVNEFVLQNAEKPVEYLKALAAAVDKQLETIEKNPENFDLKLTLGKMSKQITQLSETRAAPAEPATPPVAKDAGAMPDDFGFVAGKGYPKEYTPAILAALDTAANAVGKDGEWVDGVIKAWKDGGMKEPVTAVLTNMAKVAPADSAKLDATLNPPIVRRPPNKPGTKTTEAQGDRGNRARAAKPGSWESIEKKLATDIAKAQQTGKL